MTRLLIISVPLLCILYVHSIGAQSKWCDKNAPAANKGTSDYLLISSAERKMPTNHAEVKKFCDDGEKIYSTINKWSKTCHNKLSRRVFSLFIYSVFKHTTNMCKSKRKTSEMIAMSACGNAVKKSTVKCFDIHLGNLDSAAKEKNSRLKIPLACCSVFKMKACMISAMEKKPDMCPQSSIDRLDNLVGAYLSDVMQLMCGDYTEDNDKCDKITKDRPAPKPINKVTTTILSAMTDILDSLPDNK